jgi:sugar phosphate isomerase/epimerase
MQFSLATTPLPLSVGPSSTLKPSERQRVFQWAASAGFAGVHLSPQWFDFTSLSDAQLSELEHEAAEAGLAFSGIDAGPCIFTRTNRNAENYDLVERAIEAAAVLKANTVTFSLSLPPSSDHNRPPLRGCDVADYEHARAAEGVAELASHAARADVQLSLELHPDGLLDTPELCLEMLRRTGAWNLGVNPNLGDFIRSAALAVRGWEASLRWLAPHANHWHVKNYKHGQPAALWDGEIDYARAVAMMRSAGYGGWVSVESFVNGTTDMTRRSLDYLKSLLSVERTAPPAAVLP